jgi:hypothetical protein
MGTFGSRGGFSDKFSLPLMVLAFLVVGGFLYWLSITAQPTEVEVVEEVEDTGSGASAILDIVDFLGAPGDYEGQVIEVTRAQIVNRLGEQAFWIGTADAPFLVKMSPALLETQPAVIVEQVVTLVGQVHILTDSVLTSWDALGAFPTDTDRFLAEFSLGSPFIEVESVEAMTPGGAGAGQAGS